MTYQIGNIRDLDPDDPRFATLQEAVKAAQERAPVGYGTVYGVWDLDAPDAPLIALVLQAEVYWQDGYTALQAAREWRAAHQLYVGMFEASDDAGAVTAAEHRLNRAEGALHAALAALEVAP